MTVTLPVCRWRRQPTAPDHHVCISPRIRCNAHGIPDEICFGCRYRDHEPDPGPRPPCVHYGPLLRVEPLRLLNRTDGASVLGRVQACAVHGECSPNTVNTPLACCLTCQQHLSDYHRPRAGQVRHLTYFIYPAGPLWRWNVGELVKRLSLFNGLRVVAVAGDGGSASIDDVAECFDGQDVQLRPYVNDAGRKEMVAHMDLVAAVERYQGEGDATWYGHGKGSGSHVYGEGVQRWAREMYAGTLDYWPAVRRALVDHAAVGVFRRILSPAPAAHVPWHFSGSFRWLRNKDLFSRDWRAVDPGFYGSETYPGRHFATQECCCLYGEFAYGGVGLYLLDTWLSWAQAAADDWRTAHAADLETPMLVTIILTAHAQPDRVHEAIASVQAQLSDSWQLIVMYTGRIDAADLVGRYRTDARIHLEPTGEDERGSTDRGGQAWAINEAFRRQLVRGDLVACLSDDDVLNPGAVAAMIATARARPTQMAWYGIADRVRLHESGQVEALQQLGDAGTGGPDNEIRGRVDGLQAWVRREAWKPWPEEKELAPLADGWWLHRLGWGGGVFFVPVMIGTHRHTPHSVFTR